VKSGRKGAKKWENWFLHQVSIKPLGLPPSRRRVRPVSVSHEYLTRRSRPGFSINETEHGTTGTSISVIDSDNHCITSDGRQNAALLTYTMNYPPVSARSPTSISITCVRHSLPITASAERRLSSCCAGTSVVIEALTEVAEGTLL